MPRGRGGRRQGTPGQAYSNRSDLQSVKVAPSTQYGERAAQMAAQRAIPLAGATDPGPAAPAAASAAPAPPPQPGPPPVQAGGVTPLSAPTQRPNEPLTAGLPIGAGAGPEALGPLGGLGEDVNMQLRAIYARFPNEDMRRVLEMLDTDDGSGF